MENKGEGEGKTFGAGDPPATSSLSRTGAVPLPHRAGPSEDWPP